MKNQNHYRTVVSAIVITHPSAQYTNLSFCYFTYIQVMMLGPAPHPRPPAKTPLFSYEIQVKRCNNLNSENAQ